MKKQTTKPLTPDQQQAFTHLTPEQRAFIASLQPAQRDVFFKDVFKARAKSMGEAYVTDPVRFVREVLRADPAPYQEKILNTLVTDRRVAVRSPHGAGKSALASWALLWAIFALGDDTKVVTTASVFRQVKFLWREITKWAYKANFKPRPTILDMSIRFPERSIEAFGVSSDTPEKLEGVHASNVLLITDEAKAVGEPFHDALEGALSTGNVFALMLSTPGQPSGRFYDIHARRAGLTDWTAIHVTLDECIAAGRISREWAEDRKKQWGETSPVYRSRVLGEFSDGEDCLVPLSWVEKAQERWHDRNGKGEGSPVYGVDPARYGDDQTTICRLVSNVCEKIDYYSQDSTMKTAGRVAATVGKETPVAVDTIGLGAGVYDRLEELGLNVISVNVAESANDQYGRPLKDKSGQLTFINKRSALWWALREALDPDQDAPLALPPDDRLVGDLTAPLWEYTSSGKIKIESKEDIRKRIGRSTDAADALALALFVNRPHSVVSFTTGRAYIYRGDGQAGRQSQRQTPAEHTVGTRGKRNRFGLSVPDPRIKFKP